MVSYRNQPRSLRQRSLGTGGGVQRPGSFSVMWLAVCLFYVAILEWMPQQSKLKSGTFITNKRKPTVRTYYED